MARCLLRRHGQASATRGTVDEPRNPPPTLEARSVGRASGWRMAVASAVPDPNWNSDR